MEATIDLTIGHSPDPDDAFMWWPLGDASEGRPAEIDTGPFRFTPVADDIEALNQRAVERGDLEITAMSFHAYAQCADRYAVASAGASLGDGYGPRLVAREPIAPDALVDGSLRYAVPGVRTSAYLALRLLVGHDIQAEPMRFDLIPDAVLEGKADVGVVIHQSQITYAEEGLTLVGDLGEMWKSETGLPLPLGANAVHRDLDDRHGPGTLGQLARVLETSVRHALANRAHSLEVANAFDPGLSRELTDRFVAMYVNDFTLDLGPRGREGVRVFLERAAGAGLIRRPSHLEVVGLGGLAALS